MLECELVINLCYSVAVVVGNVLSVLFVLAVLFDYLLTGCQLFWTFLCASSSSLGQWAWEAVYLTAQAGWMAVEYISKLPWTEWATTVAVLGGTFLNSVSSVTENVVLLLASGRFSAIPSLLQLVALVFAFILLIAAWYTVRTLYATGADPAQQKRGGTSLVMGS